MNYREVLKAGCYVGTIVHITFSKYREERVIEFYQAMQDAYKELDSLGNDLTIDDFERVKEIAVRLERNAASYRSMTMLKEAIERDYYLNKFKEIDDGVKGVEF
jgi:hypothetical protein